MNTYRMPRKRVKPRRKRPELFGHDHGLRLRGKAKTEQRRLIFERSKGRCEEKDDLYSVFGAYQVRCNQPITWESMEWSHNRHAANKCDCLSCGIASCHECHERRHNPKSCPPKVTSALTGNSRHTGAGISGYIKQD